jgi:hypothetical protein
LDAPNGVLYAETLSVGLVLDVLANCGVAKPKVPSPRGRRTRANGAITFGDGAVDLRNFDGHTPPYMKDAPSRSTYTLCEGPKRHRD